ncbi:MAG: hypothetical protein FD148_3595 [Methylocystaceae bacterium]|nr:MAG: hypothetical protein FD148_3595 [Methylocystaceae bacterium]
MSRHRLGVDPDEPESRGFVRQPLGHVLQEMTSPIGRKHDRFAAFGDRRAGLALERDMPDDLAARIAGHDRNELSAFDFPPIAVRRKDFAVNVIVSIDRQEAARDRRRVALLRHVDPHRFRGLRGFGNRLFVMFIRFTRGVETAMDRDLPSVDAAFPVG